VTVAARVPPALAREVARLANAGDRTVSREVARAIREHVASQVPGVLPSLRPEIPAQHVVRVPEENVPAVETRRQRAGQEGA
jgi:hypothetical protein